MPLPLPYQYDESAAPVQFVSPGQGYYNPPPNSQAYKNTVAHVPIQTTPSRSPSQPGKARVRPLSVDEALQFSPLCSIIPFDISMVPLPDANVHLSRSSFNNADDKRAGDRKLHMLNESTIQSRGTSGDAKKSLEAIRTLMGHAEMPCFQFKVPPTRPSKKKEAAGDEKCAPPRLGAFAKLLVDNSEPRFRIGPSSPGPETKPFVRQGSIQLAREQKSQATPPVSRKASKSQTPGPQPPPPLPPPPPRQKSVTAPSPQPQQVKVESIQTPSPQIRSNQLAFNANQQQAKFTPSIHVPPVPSDFHVQPLESAPLPATSTQQQPGIAVEIERRKDSPNLQTSDSTLQANLQVIIEPKLKSEASQSPQVIAQALPQSANHSGFQVVIPPSSSQPGFDSGDWKASKLDDTGVYDQRNVTDATLKDLQEVVSDVLETEAEAQATGLSSATEGIITSAAGSDGEKYVLTSPILIRLDALFRKAIEKRRLAGFRSEYILQVQKICERSFSCAENMQINLASDWTTLEEAARNREADACQQTLQSARVILRTMTGGRADKQVLSEELLQQSILLLNKVVDGLVLPAVEARSTGADTALYNTAVSCKKLIINVLYDCNKLMQLLLQILTREEIAESAVNQVEYFAIRMLFVENAPTEKESVLGIVKFESFRRLAMLVLVEIFTRYPEQRQFIISEVLTSLQKLPTARQHGRQFKLEGSGKRLQLVTVLLVRFVQASGVNTIAKSTKSLLKAEKSHADEDDDDDSEGSDEDEPVRLEEVDSEDEMEDDNDIVPPKLVKNVKKLHDASINTAWHVVSFLVQKALTASKSGEQPHRHLLDMFIEDLIVVLGIPEWPGAELLLQLLVNKMKELVESPKTNAPMKTMALETLGTLGTAILDVTFESRSVVKSLENDDSQTSHRLVGMFESNMQNQLRDSDVCNWKGPFRIAMDHAEKNDLHGRTNSAQGFLLTKWAKTLLWGGKGTNNQLDVDRLSGGARGLAISLAKMTISGKWENPEPVDVSASQARLAYLVAILHIGFCQSFSFILSLLMSSITSEHITVRARALKSVTQMLEKDPTLLDRHRSVIGLILKCTSDPSASVKDSSLALLGKCITLRPSIEREVLQAIINAASDQTVGIRKRALKLLRDAYLREDANAHSWRTTVKSLAVNSIFQRTSDEEESVVELCQQIFEEIWMDPFREIAAQDKISSSGNISLKEQMALIIQSLRDHDDLSKPTEQLVRHSLSGKGKAAESSRKICKALVACAFEGIIDSTDLPGSPAAHEILQALTIFARTDPKLFTAEHVELLKPYVSYLSNGDDLDLFRGVVAIFRSVLPTLPSVQQETLRKIQNDLQVKVPKLPKAELDEVASCLWTICTVLKNPERLVKLTISCLQNLQKMQAQKDVSDELVQKIQRLIRIAGHFGKYCDFQPQLSIFKTQLPTLKGDLVAAMIVAGIRPYTSQERPLNCRAVAWEGIGMICQSWPRAFNNPSISGDIQQVLQGDELELQRIVLTSIRDFFMSQDQTHDTEVNALVRDPLAQGKLGGSMTATDNDGAAALIAQAYLKHILRIALTHTDTIALVATEVVAGISRQGLVHPKEVGPAMVALATSPSQKVVNVSLQQLQSLHSQHETLFEREYMRAVHEAFVYQRDIVGDVSGYTNQPIRAKLHHVYEVIKTSKAKFVTKFLTNICGRLDFDLAKMDTKSEGEPPQLQYARFLIENLVFFDFSRLDDINHVITCIEKSVAATGSVVAHAINTELLQVTVENVLSQNAADPEPEIDLDDGTLGGFLPEPVLSSIEDSMGFAPEPKPEVPELDPARARQLTAGAVVLTMMWETRTFLRRLYNINANTQNKSKAKNAKDPNKAPQRSNFVSSDKFLETIAALPNALGSTEASKERCKKFAELMAIDDELKVANGDDEDMDGEANGISYEDMGTDGVGRGMKRKGSISSSGTPKKRQRSKPARSAGPDSRRGSPDTDTWE